MSAARAHVISNYLQHNETRELCLTCKYTVAAHNGEKSHRRASALFFGPQSRKITFFRNSFCVFEPLVPFRLFLPALMVRNYEKRECILLYACGGKNERENTSDGVQRFLCVRCNFPAWICGARLRWRTLQRI